MRVRKVTVEVKVDVSDYGFPPAGLGSRAAGLLEQAVVSGLLAFCMSDFVPEVKILSDEMLIEDRDLTAPVGAW